MTGYSFSVTSNQIMFWVIKDFTDINFQSVFYTGYLFCYFFLFLDRQTKLPVICAHSSIG